MELLHISVDVFVRFSSVNDVLVEADQFHGLHALLTSTEKEADGNKLKRTVRARPDQRRYLELRIIAIEESDKLVVQRTLEQHANWLTSQKVILGSD